MLTVEVHATMVRLAGPSFAWNNGVAGHRPTAAARVGLRYFLGQFSDFRCAACGKDVDFSEAETCHIVSRGKAKRGFLFGNLFYGCSACNIAQKDNGPVVEFHDLIADLIPGPNDNPGMPFLTNLGNSLR